jgi:choline dehydrogenase-like flavoprotein
MSLIAPWESAAQYKRQVLRLRQVFSFIVLSRDRSDAGQVRLDATGAPRLYYPLGAHDAGSLVDGMAAAIKIAAAAGATAVGTSIVSMGLVPLPPPPPPRSSENDGGDGDDDGDGDNDDHRRSPSSLKCPAEAERRAAEAAREAAVEELVARVKAHGVAADFRTALFSAHQMGTCRMGSDPRKSVVGPSGEAWGCRNLFVCDASVFPTSSGVNPMLTTMSIADGVADHVVEALRQQQQQRTAAGKAATRGVSSPARL